jgi:hypothetical protein
VKNLRRAIPLLVSLSAFGAAVGGSAQDPKQPAPQAPQAGAQAEKNQGGVITKEEAAELAKTIAPIVEEIRGLKFKHPVPVEVVDDAAARGHFEDRLHRHWPEGQRRADQVVYEALGLLPKNTDMEQEVYDVLEEQAGGYYDPDRDTFFVLGDMPRAAAPIIVAHELTHALDDQTYGIDAMVAKTLDDDDRGAAMDALVEGSGTLVMSVFIRRQLDNGALDPVGLAGFQNSEVGQAVKLKASPRFVQEALIAPYILGMAFLLRGELIRFHTGGITPSDIDHAFRDPPQSTEQILHPEKYWDPARRDRPRAVSFADLSVVLGPGFRQEAEGTLGELTLGLLTGVDPGDPTSPEGALERWTNAAASGWGGDLWHLYRNGDTAVVVVATVWDSERDAREFEAAVKPPAGKVKKRKGDAVVLIAGDAPIPKHLFERVFATLQSPKSEN